MAVPQVTYTFTNGRTSDGNEVSTNFNDIIYALTDGAKSLTVNDLSAEFTTLDKSIFNSQGAAYSSGTINALYVAGGDLYYNDKNGSSIQLTAGGGINAVNQPIPGVVSPVSFSYSAGIFSGKSAATTYAKFDMADLKLYENTAGITNGITLKSPAALAASYTITLPTAVPAASAFVLMSAAGALSTTVTNDATLADTIAGAMTATGADAIAADITATGANAIIADVSAVPATQANLAANARTRSITADGTDPGVGGISISASSGLYVTTSTSLVAVSQLSCTLTTQGRPVVVNVSPDGSGLSEIGSVDSAGAGSQAHFAIYRGATQIAYTEVSGQAAGATSEIHRIPPGTLNIVDVSATTGKLTYTVWALGVGGNSAEVLNCKLITYEL